MRLRTYATGLCCAGAAAAFLFAAPAMAQTGRAASNWFCSCPGGQREVPNSMNGPAPDCRQVCFPGGGSSGGRAGSSAGGGGLTSLQQMQLNMAGQVGGLLGGMLHEALFGSPQGNQQAAANRAAQEAAERAAEEARRAEQQRALEEERRRQDDMRNRLLASMKSGGATQELAIRGVDSGPALQFRIDETLAPRLSELPASSAIAQLTRAAFFSEQAAGAPTSEDAAMLADAAFNATIGVPVDLPVPPATVTVRMEVADVNRIEITRGQYLDATGVTNTVLATAAQAEQQRAVAQRVLDRAQSDLAAQRNAFMRNPSPDLKPRIVRAERIVAEARKLVETQEAQVAATRAAADKTQANIANIAATAVDIMDGLRRIQRSAGAYQRGILDGALCMPSNAGQYCANLGDQQKACMEKYDSGFGVGERGKEAKLREAHTIGLAARQGGDSFVGFNHPKSVGPCRVRWLEVFYSGFRGFPFNMTGR